MSHDSPSTGISRRTVLTGAATAAVAAGFTWLAPPRASAAAMAPTARPQKSAVIDSVVFGDSASEAAHGFSGTLTSAITGGLGQPGRVLHPRTPAGWWGGESKVRLRVASSGTTYLTIKLWGDDHSPDYDHEYRLQALIDGKQLGWFEQGPVDNLDFMGRDPRLYGQFFLHTLPLPEWATVGKESVEVTVLSMGRIWSYGGPDNYYYGQVTDSRGIYRLYTHAEPFFVPDASDPFGDPPGGSIRPISDAGAIAQARDRALRDQNTLLYTANAHTMDGWSWMGLAEGYSWADSPAYGNPLAIERVCQAIDGRYNAWRQNAAVLTESDQQWQGFGRVGLALCTLWDVIQPNLDADVTTGSTLLANPSFEVGFATPTGWQVFGWANGGTITRDTTVVVQGSASLRIDSTAAKSCIVGPAARVQVGPGNVSFTVKVKNAAPENHRTYVNVLFWTAAGVFVGGDHRTFAATGTTEWQELSNTITVPDGATQLEFWCSANEGQTAWFDDIQLTTPAPVAANPIPRRAAYRAMLLASRDYWRQNQRHYSNQAMITSMGIYQANRGLALLSPADAWPEERARTWIHEAIGMAPWAGSETAAGEKTWPLGRDYRISSETGLTRELGYVGGYGEVTDWLCMIYESITGGAGGSPAPDIRAHMLRMVKARQVGRFQGADEDGHSVMRLATGVGWRNEEFPGEIAYVERTSWDGHPLEAAALFDDDDLMAWTKQMIADGQLAPQLELFATDSLYTRVSLNCLHFIARDLPVIAAASTAARRLPMQWGQPDLVFTDETNGFVAVKRGDELLFASLYYRARQAINGWARVHLIAPGSERIATVNEYFEGGTGSTFTIQNWQNLDYAINDSNGGASPLPAGGWPSPEVAYDQVWAGKVMPLAPVPADMDVNLGGTTIGVETLLVGRAPFYVMEYAGYVILMNTTADRTFSHQLENRGRATDLRTGSEIALRRPLRIGPKSTRVLWIGR